MSGLSFTLPKLATSIHAIAILPHLFFTGIMLFQHCRMIPAVNCWSASRFDADRRANSLISLVSEGQISAPINSENALAKLAAREIVYPAQITEHLRRGSRLLSSQAGTAIERALPAFRLDDGQA